jgi:T5SS/PEP-CTERM-associated repeat protein
MRASKHSPLFFLAAFLLTWFSASVLRAQTNYVGSNSSGESSYYTSGKASYSATYVGYDVGANSNSLSVENTNTVLTNSGVLRVGQAGSANSLVISNGGTVQNSTGIIGFTNSSNNSVLVTGKNSLWSNSAAVIVSRSGASNSMVISDGGTVKNSVGTIGSNSLASNNSVLVTGTNSLWSNSSSLTVGGNGSSNSMVISNGGKVQNTAGFIGFGSSSNNSVLVTGMNSLWIGDYLYVGYSGASNILVISNGGTVRNADGLIGSIASSSNNSVLVTGIDSL